MSLLSKKNVVWHVLLIVIVILVTVLLIVYPLKAHALTVIQHQDYYGRARAEQSQSNISDRALRNARSEERADDRALENANRDVLRAYEPRTPLEAPTRQYDILNAESHYYETQNDVRSASNSRYLNQRKLEGAQRELNIQEQYRHMHNKVYPYNGKAAKGHHKHHQHPSSSN